MEKSMQLENYVGQPLDVVLPSGRTVTIREQNGDDDETLSLISNGKQGNMENINRFLASLILVDHATGNNFMSLDSVKKMRLRDKYYLLMKSRIHSLGPIVKYTNVCTNRDCKSELQIEENLEDFDNDLKSYRSETGNKNPRAIKPYADNGANEYHEFTISSTKKLRFRYLDGFGEEMALDAYTKSASKNTALTIRELSIFHNNEWKVLGSFGIFSAREMGEIQNEVERLDSQFVMASEIECPNCKNKMVIPLNSIDGFFFLSEM